MKDASLFHPLSFRCGAVMKNRFMLAPMTNTQSHEDGKLSDEEYHWLTMRAKGGFGLVMTCASHVQKVGKGFPGQLGIYDDSHVPGHQRLSRGIKEHGSLAVIQLHHAGMRSPKEIIGEAPVCPSDNVESGARGLSLEEVFELREDFIMAAIRARNAGYDGVEVHGAHGYILTQFLSKEINHRTDAYGGSLENRARIIFEIIKGIRKACGSSFLIGLRLSPEKWGMDLGEIKTVSQWIIEDELVDFLDISLWDWFKMPEDPLYQEQSLLSHIVEINKKDTRLTVAGKIINGVDVLEVMNTGVDFVTIGRSAILHHDFPLKIQKNKDFKAFIPPVSYDYLHREGLSDKFISYMKRWPNFVEEPSN